MQTYKADILNIMTLITYLKSYNLLIFLIENPEDEIPVKESV